VSFDLTHDSSDLPQRSKPADDKEEVAAMGGIGEEEMGAGRNEGDAAIVTDNYINTLMAMSEQVAAMGRIGGEEMGVGNHEGDVAIVTDNRINTLMAMSHFLRHTWTLSPPTFSPPSSSLSSPQAAETFEILAAFLRSLIQAKEQVFFFETVSLLFSGLLRDSEFLYMF